MNLKKTLSWKKILAKSLIVSIILIITNFLIVYFIGPTIWLYAGHFLGNDIKTTLSTLLFVEGLIVLALGAMWISGSMEARFDGSNILTNPYRRREQWKQRPDELEQENIAGKVMILVGVPVLIVALILIFE